MAKDQACKLQILSAKHPDILQAVDAMFNRFHTVLQVHQMIERQYHEFVGLTAVRSYKQNHWQVFKDMVREQKAAVQGIAEIIGDDGLSMGVNALLWQELQKLSAPQLIAFRKVLNDSEKVAQLKKQVALQVEEHRQKMKERAAESKDRKETTVHVDPAEDYARAQKVVNRVKEIFGIGMSAPKASNAKPAGPAEPSPALAG